MISEQIKNFRKNLGYSQEYMAKLLNMSRQGYAHYESGDAEPNIDTIKKLCIIFDCTSDELLEIETDSERKKFQINNLLNKKA